MFFYCLKFFNFFKTLKSQTQLYDMIAYNDHGIEMMLQQSLISKTKKKI